jgi:predicted kinase
MISAKLIFLCGKMAAGKSTLARDLAQRENAVLLVQDEFLDHLFPGEIIDIPGFVKHSSRLRNALGPHVCALLSKGISVVLDFPGTQKRSGPGSVSSSSAPMLSMNCTL